MTEETKVAADTVAPDAAPPTAPACPAHRNARRYTSEIAARILTELQKSRSLRSVCRDDGMPSYRTVLGWVLRDVEGFAARYAEAIDIGGRRGARLVRYSHELADRIVGEVERGRTLADVSRDPGMPSYSTLLGWIGRISEFATRYYRAVAIGNPPHGGKDLFTPEIVERVLAGLAGDRTLFDICLDDDLPSESTVCKWVREDREGFAARYYAARAAGRARMGRPTLYTPEIAERILFEIAERRGLRDICQASGMPSTTTVRLWVATNRDGFAARFEQARKFALLDVADQLLEIVDDGRNDWMERRAHEGDGAAAVYRESARRSRLRFDGRRWILAKELPEIYGDRPAPPVKPEESVEAEAWAAYLKLVDGKSRGLPCDEEPVDEVAWAAFEARFPGFPYGVGKDRA